VLPSPRRSTLIRELAPLVNRLTALPDVQRVTLFRAVVMPPTARFSAYLKGEPSLQIANFDVITLLETTSAERARQIQQVEPFTSLVDAMRRRARYRDSTPSR